MSLQEHIKRSYTAILKEELLVAMGCTEPIAIAYAAAILRRTLDAVPKKIQAKFSGNIIKNVKSVIVPATGGLHGLEAAISAGIVAACPERVLEVLTVLTPDDQPAIRAFLGNCDFSIEEMETPHAFDLELKGFANGTCANVRITGNHTNVVSVTKGEDDVTGHYAHGCYQETKSVTDRSVLNVEDILAFANETSLDELQPLL